MSAAPSVFPTPAPFKEQVLYRQGNPLCSRFNQRAGAASSPCHQACIACCDLDVSFLTLNNRRIGKRPSPPSLKRDLFKSAQTESSPLCFQLRSHIRKFRTAGEETDRASRPQRDRSLPALNGRLSSGSAPPLQTNLSSRSRRIQGDGAGSGDDLCTGSLFPTSREDNLSLSRRQMDGAGLRLQAARRAALF